MSYYRADASKLAGSIRQKLPDATVENWRDYGYAVDVCLNGRIVTACQPGRLDIGQPEIFRSVEDVMRLLTKH